jgi:hypothetical protein
MNDVKLAQPGYHILEIITPHIIARCRPICPHLAQGCRLPKATEDCMPRFVDDNHAAAARRVEEHPVI